ncbi:conserved Plasmodium protein, unknown function [Plasmodium knowlesi strain H]|uniref:Zinc finger protein n=3 Tax=Plasmodium knowlesi TaxID=5850 RepID=A0A5K1TWY8_PLAKH|nr:conserved Plasmodium protein, unknown function [Plasmodium knowlesi strain H]OTN63764.1 Uncharacterized protein PKNOH_S140240600 [Plasmodium knowlesi]CAA9990828.1 conserved Plasmodium protein, unknown function [Plasmodium knowlesi strain H]SBO20988.1 conserved Plasmodium protein, unknown function [Plasmodium knowlesi strain H]SBO21482.1 conserved Plasmodium protein, unknown function [Plasmodium knowlesi strain H]VVS80302.1 conserved Plasmodium protein, unknown function [Plasmodium knowlesi |eukprot:XP_002262116.1 hypothetical protein, conserved in Plasmodium species [Plasmodium knowlesi strain H]
MDVEQKQHENAYCVYKKNFDETRVSSNSSSGSATESHTGSSNNSNNNSGSNNGFAESKGENGDNRGESVENYMTSCEENEDAEEKYTNHELSEKNISASTSNLNKSFDPLQFQNEYNGNGIVSMKWDYENGAELPDGTHSNMYLRGNKQRKGNENLTNYDMPNEIEEERKYIYTRNENGEALNMYGIQGKGDFEIDMNCTQEMSTMFSCKESRNICASTKSTNSNGRSTVQDRRGTEPMENVLIGQTAQSCEQGEYKTNTEGSGDRGNNENSGSSGSGTEGKNVELAGNEDVSMSLSNRQNQVNNGDPSTYNNDKPLNEETPTKFESMRYYDMKDVSGNKLNDYISNMQVMRDSFTNNHLSNMGRSHFDISADVGSMSYEAVTGMSGMSCMSGTNSVENMGSPTRMNDFDHLKNMGECSDLQKIMEGNIVKEMNQFSDKANSDYINFMKMGAEDNNLNSLNSVDVDYYDKGVLYNAASDESGLLKGQAAGTNQNNLFDASGMNMGNTMNDTQSVNSTSTLSNINGGSGIGTIGARSTHNGISTLNSANSISNISNMSALSSMSALSTMSGLSNISGMSSINALNGINALNDAISLSTMNSLNEDSMNIHTNLIERNVSKEDVYLMTQGEASKNTTCIKEEINNEPIVYNDNFSSEGMTEKNFPYQAQTFHVAELSKEYNQMDKGNTMNLQGKDENVKNDENGKSMLLSTRYNNMISEKGQMNDASENVYRNNLYNGRTFEDVKNESAEKGFIYPVHNNEGIKQANTNDYLHKHYKVCMDGKSSNYIVNTNVENGTCANNLLYQTSDYYHKNFLHNEDTKNDVSAYGSVENINIRKSDGQTDKGTNCNVNNIEQRLANNGKGINKRCRKKRNTPVESNAQLTNSIPCDNSNDINSENNVDINNVKMDDGTIKLAELNISEEELNKLTLSMNSNFTGINEKDELYKTVLFFDKKNNKMIKMNKPLKRKRKLKKNTNEENDNPDQFQCQEGSIDTSLVTQDQENNEQNENWKPISMDNAEPVGANNGAKGGSAKQNQSVHKHSHNKSINGIFTSQNKELIFTPVSRDSQENNNLVIGHNATHEDGTHENIINESGVDYQRHGAGNYKIGRSLSRENINNEGVISFLADGNSTGEYTAQGHATKGAKRAVDRKYKKLRMNEHAQMSSSNTASSSGSNNNESNLFRSDSCSSFPHRNPDVVKCMISGACNNNSYTDKPISASSFQVQCNKMYDPRNGANGATYIDAVRIGTGEFLAKGDDIFKKATFAGDMVGTMKDKHGNSNLSGSGINNVELSSCGMKKGNENLSSTYYTSNNQVIAGMFSSHGEFLRDELSGSFEGNMKVKIEENQNAVNKGIVSINVMNNIGMNVGNDPLGSNIISGNGNDGTGENKYVKRRGKVKKDKGTPDDYTIQNGEVVSGIPKKRRTYKLKNKIDISRRNTENDEAGDIYVGIPDAENMAPENESVRLKRGGRRKGSIKKGFILVKQEGNNECVGDNKFHANDIRICKNEMTYGIVNSTMPFGEPFGVINHSKDGLTPDRVMANGMNIKLEGSHVDVDGTLCSMGVINDSIVNVNAEMNIKTDFKSKRKPKRSVNLFIAQKSKSETALEKKIKSRICLQDYYKKNKEIYQGIDPLASINGVNLPSIEDESFSDNLTVLFKKKKKNLICSNCLYGFKIQISARNEFVQVPAMGKGEAPGDGPEEGARNWSQDDPQDNAQCATQDGSVNSNESDKRNDDESVHTMMDPCSPGKHLSEDEGEADVTRSASEENQMNPPKSDNLETDKTDRTDRTDRTDQPDQPDQPDQKVEAKSTGDVMKELEENSDIIEKIKSLKYLKISMYKELVEKNILVENYCTITFYCLCGYFTCIKEDNEWKQITNCYFDEKDKRKPKAPHIFCTRCKELLVTNRFLDKDKTKIIMICECGSRNYDRTDFFWSRRGNIKQRKAPQILCDECNSKMWVHTWLDDIGSKVKLLCKCGFKNFLKKNNNWVRSPRWKKPVPLIICNSCHQKMYMSQWLNNDGTKVKMKCECGWKTLIKEGNTWVRSEWSKKLLCLKLVKNPELLQKKYNIHPHKKSKSDEEEFSDRNSQNGLSNMRDGMIPTFPPSDITINHHDAVMNELCNPNHLENCLDGENNVALNKMRSSDSFMISEATEGLLLADDNYIISNNNNNNSNGGVEGGPNDSLFVWGVENGPSVGQAIPYEDVILRKKPGTRSPRGGRGRGNRGYRSVGRGNIMSAKIDSGNHVGVNHASGNDVGINNVSGNHVSMNNVSGNHVEGSHVGVPPDGGDLCTRGNAENNSRGRRKPRGSKSHLNSKKRGQNVNLAENKDYHIASLETADGASNSHNNLINLNGTMNNGLLGDAYITNNYEQGKREADVDLNKGVPCTDGDAKKMNTNNGQKKKPGRPPIDRKDKKVKKTTAREKFNNTENASMANIVTGVTSNASVATTAEAMRPGITTTSTTAACTMIYNNENSPVSQIYQIHQTNDDILIDNMINKKGSVIIDSIIKHPDQNLKGNKEKLTESNMISSGPTLNFYDEKYANGEEKPSSSIGKMYFENPYYYVNGYYDNSYDKGYSNHPVVSQFRGNSNGRNGSNGGVRSTDLYNAYNMASGTYEHQNKEFPVNYDMNRSTSPMTNTKFVEDKESPDVLPMDLNFQKKKFIVENMKKLNYNISENDMNILLENVDENVLVDTLLGKFVDKTNVVENGKMDDSDVNLNENYANHLNGGNSGFTNNNYNSNDFNQTEFRSNEMYSNNNMCSYDNYTGEMFPNGVYQVGINEGGVHQNGLHQSGPSQSGFYQDMIEHPFSRNPSADGGARESHPISKENINYVVMENEDGKKEIDCKNMNMVNGQSGADNNFNLHIAERNGHDMDDSMNKGVGSQNMTNKIMACKNMGRKNSMNNDPCRNDYLSSNFSYSNEMMGEKDKYNVDVNLDLGERINLKNVTTDCELRSGMNNDMGGNITGNLDHPPGFENGVYDNNVNDNSGGSGNNNDEHVTIAQNDGLLNMCNLNENLQYFSNEFKAALAHVLSDKASDAQKENFQNYLKNLASNFCNLANKENDLTSEKQQGYNSNALSCEDENRYLKDNKVEDNNVLKDILLPILANQEENGTPVKNNFCSEYNIYENMLNMPKMDEKIKGEEMAATPSYKPEMNDMSQDKNNMNDMLCVYNFNSDSEEKVCTHERKYKINDFITVCTNCNEYINSNMDCKIVSPSSLDSMNNNCSEQKMNAHHEDFLLSNDEIKNYENFSSSGKEERKDFHGVSPNRSMNGSMSGSMNGAMNGSMNGPMNGSASDARNSERNSISHNSNHSSSIPIMENVDDMSHLYNQYCDYYVNNTAMDDMHMKNNYLNNLFFQDQNNYSATSDNCTNNQSPPIKSENFYFTEDNNYLSDSTTYIAGKNTANSVMQFKQGTCAENNLNNNNNSDGNYQEDDYENYINSECNNNSCYNIIHT